MDALRAVSDFDSRKKATVKLKRVVLLAIAWLACILGFVGVVVPVLPTTPLLLLATFLFAKASPRCQAWIEGTKAYQTYVLPFKQAGGITVRVKVRMLVVSYILMGVSALVVRRPLVWTILGCVSLFLLWLVVLRIPTLGRDGSLTRPFGLPVRTRRPADPKADA